MYCHRLQIASTMGEGTQVYRCDPSPWRWTEVLTQTYTPLHTSTLQHPGLPDTPWYTDMGAALTTTIRSTRDG